MSDIKYVPNKGEPIRPIKARVMNLFRFTPYPTIKCPNCGKEVTPELLNESANITICPKCRTKLSG
jgi:DNA-directed RNA polymerase subunit RPC12/RpoP